MNNSALDRFFAINRDVCEKLERYLPQAKLKIFMRLYSCRFKETVIHT